MPSSNHTPRRSIRVDTAIWRAAEKAAEAQGITISELIRRHLVQVGRKYRD